MGYVRTVCHTTVLIFKWGKSTLVCTINHNSMCSKNLELLSCFTSLNITKEETAQ